MEYSESGLYSRVAQSGQPESWVLDAYSALGSATEGERRGIFYEIAQDAASLPRLIDRLITNYNSGKFSANK